MGDIRNEISLKRLFWFGPPNCGFCGGWSREFTFSHLSWVSMNRWSACLIIDYTAINEKIGVLYCAILQRIDGKDFRTIYVHLIAESSIATLPARYDPPTYVRRSAVHSAYIEFNTKP